MIAKAFRSWERASTYSIKIKGHWNQKKPGEFHEMKDFSYKNPKIFIWSLNENEEKQLASNLIDTSKTYNGYYIPGPKESAHILIFIDEDKLLYGENIFYRVALHEVGHMLGISHLDIIGTVMYKHSGSNCITIHDAEALCDLYGCEPNSEC